MIEHNIETINRLFQQHHINDEIVSFQRLSGTTSGIVLRLESKQGVNEKHGRNLMKLALKKQE